MIRNLTAAEPSPDPALDSLMDSALPEQFRGALPTVRRLSAFRAVSKVAFRTNGILGGWLIGHPHAAEPDAHVPGLPRAANAPPEAA